MAIYHLSVKAISRSGGRSSVASVAYRAGERLTNERDGLTHDYSRRKGVEHSEILAPDDAPDWVRDRGRLWNAVEGVEKRKDARLAREVEVSLPRELTREQQVDALRGFIREEFTSRGMVADFAVHAPLASDGAEQPHAHVMLTTREIGPEGFGKKVREWDRTEALEGWRGAWERHANRALEVAGHEARIDHRSLKAQRAAVLEVANDAGRPEPERRLAEVKAVELDREPQPKLGSTAAAMERRGVPSIRGELVRETTELNSLRKQLAEIGRKVAELGKAAGEKTREAWRKLDLSAAKARWRSLGLDASALDGPAPDRQTPEARLARGLADLDRATAEITSDRAHGLVSLSSTLEDQRQAADQVAKALRALVKTDPAKAWETSRRLETRAELPQGLRELKREFAKELSREIGRDATLARRLGQDVVREVNRTLGRARGIGISF